jgi:hypothetical protein
MIIPSGKKANGKMKQSLPLPPEPVRCVKILEIKRYEKNLLPAMALAKLNSVAAQDLEAWGGYSQCTEPGCCFR